MKDSGVDGSVTNASATPKRQYNSVRERKMTRNIVLR
ncbi:hypothetical protein SPHINGOT1_310023 [Sphingomonas sp. T1]|nr:hypothetical protein SPHINGOT1_310023 [Sphingomonas sp. T1]